MGYLRLVVATTSLTVLAAYCATDPCLGQDSSSTKNTESSGDYVFRSTVRRVPVDVVVLDKNGNPVRGLKKDDFVVKEDGKTQTVLSFDTFDGSVPAYVPPKMPTLPANTFVDVPSTPERGPLYILYYDMVNTSRDDQMTARAELLKFVDHAPVGTRIALFVNAKRLELVQGFTTDHSLLRDAILRRGPGPTVPQVFLFGNVFGRYDVGAVLSNLNYISEYLAGLPERKNLIWLSTYFPIPVGPTVTRLDTTMPSSAPVSGQIGGMGGPETLDLTELEADNIKRTYSEMMKSRVALYPISLSGTLGDNRNIGPGGADATVDQQNMDSIAAATGGKAFYSDNHPSLLIDKAIEHGESYYTLSYSPQNTNFDGKARSIQVALEDSTKKYTLTYRTLYYAVSDKDAQDAHVKQVLQRRFLAAKEQDTLYATVEHGAPMVHDLLFVARMRTVGEPRMATAQEMQSLEDSPAYFKTRKKNKALKPLAPVKLQQYQIDYDVIDPNLRALAAAKPTPTVLEFAAAAYNSEGTLLNSILNEGALSGEQRGGPKVDNLFHAVQQLEVPPGAAYLRVVVRNKLNDRTGALEVMLPLKAENQSAAVRAGQGGMKD
jgi:VWFA-related protein